MALDLEKDRLKIRIQCLVTNFDALFVRKIGNRLRKGLWWRNMSPSECNRDYGTIAR